MRIGIRRRRDDGGQPGANSVAGGPSGKVERAVVVEGHAGKALAFEDSEAGIAAAKDAGLWVAAITSTNHFGHDQSRADLLIADLTAISPAWIEGLAFSRPT